METLKGSPLLVEVGHLQEVPHDQMILVVEIGNIDGQSYMRSKRLNFNYIIFTETEETEKKMMLIECQKQRMSKLQ